jgi:hypothetical protein
MSHLFRWNPYADQPHNVAPKSERFWYHIEHFGSYINLISANIRKAAPVLWLYRKHKRNLYKKTCSIKKAFALSVSSAGSMNPELLKNLEEIGVEKVLVRIPSWEQDKLDGFEKFIGMLNQNGFEVLIALLQQRADVMRPQKWAGFLDEVFSRFSKTCSYFEAGHAWNRTKWGIWDFKEYLNLAYTAVSLSRKHKVKLVGPAVIDFEFHLYPPVLEEITFDKVSSLLYVDRMGAPENKQFGWDTQRKVALLKAVVDGCTQKENPLWITEVNWPLEGTGKYSPAAGKPNVSESEQADYLVRYYILCLASGYIERIYWWQLVAPGYGLIDSREKRWRKRVSFYAYKTLVSRLEGSTFLKKTPHPHAEIFLFRKKEENFAVCWTKGKKEAPLFKILFPRRIIKVTARDGQEVPFRDNKIDVEGSPKYIFYEDK